MKERNMDRFKFRVWSPSKKRMGGCDLMIRADATIYSQDRLACKDNNMSAVEGDSYFGNIDSENYYNGYCNDTLLFREYNQVEESTFWERFNESHLIVKICAGYLAGVFIAAVGMVLFYIFQR